MTSSVLAAFQQSIDLSNDSCIAAAKRIADIPRFSYFRGAIGAIDGTHVPVVPMAANDVPMSYSVALSVAFCNQRCFEIHPSLEMQYICHSSLIYP